MPTSGAGADNPRPLCRHCKMRAGRVGRNGSRGLCRVCYWNPEVRALYPAIGRGAPGQERREYAPLHKETDRPGRTPRKATDALPGSEEKIRVMRQRFLNGESLFHPEDAATCGPRDERCDLTAHQAGRH